MIEDKLRENAELHPDKLALLCNGESYTYGHLYQLVLDKAASMEGIGGQLIPMIATSTADFHLLLCNPSFGSCCRSFT